MNALPPAQVGQGQLHRLLTVCNQSLLGYTAALNTFGF